MTTPLPEAIDGMKAIHSAMWFDVGPKLTCSEADALAELFDALGLDDHAWVLREGHAAGDEEYDSHYQGESDDTP